MKKRLLCLFILLGISTLGASAQVLLTEDEVDVKRFGQQSLYMMKGGRNG